MKTITQEKSPIKQKILQYLEHKGISAYEFYKSSGVTRGILTQNNGINEDNLARFLAYAKDINTEWLLTGNGEMLTVRHKTQVSTASVVQQPVATGSDHESKMESFIETYKNSHNGIPLVSERAVGGFANEHFLIKEKDVLAYYVIPKFKHLGVDFMIEVIGDSMIPKFYPGDIIACSIINHSRYIEWNKCHMIATIDRGMLVKRIMPGTDKDCLTAVSDNKEYPPFDIPKDEITGMARIVGVIHIE